ncbi:MAG: hypothetical protein HY22_07355 [[Candidatus Thermochlorobacteriaceae] bacterium GBChlB]|nr:MAG: hypothetical protein HY22_07355 [[Candidatus Thermochlorobacteriaceae] bacterium GBChlB]
MKKFRTMQKATYATVFLVLATTGVTALLAACAHDRDEVMHPPVFARFRPLNGQAVRFEVSITNKISEPIIVDPLLIVVIAPDGRRINVKFQMLESGQKVEPSNFRKRRFDVRAGGRLDLIYVDDFFLSRPNEVWLDATQAIRTASGDVVQVTPVIARPDL